MILNLTRNKILISAIVVVGLYLAFFGVLFSYGLVGNEMSFLFQIVVAMMSTGILAIVTGAMLIFQYGIETRKENSAKVFENKITFYFDTLNQLDNVFNGGLSEDTSHRLLFLTTKSMLVCSPDAANKFALLAEAIEKTDGIPLRFKNFINSARRDLDLIDNVDAGASNRFDIILKKLETAVSEETQNFRFRTDDENKSYQRVR